MSLHGCYTALVTPFKNGNVDYPTFAKLIEAQIAGGVDGVVPCGTTGESPTLTPDEHHKVLEFVVEKVNGRIDVIAGTGSNATAKTIEMTKFAEKIGADGALLVAPYYNKPTQEGLYQHFAAVAKETKLKLVLYNIPGRSGIPIAPETTARLAELESIAAIKESSGDVNNVSILRRLCDLTVLCGDDPLTLPMMVMGATGVVSVGSNLVPAETVALTRAVAEGDLDEALRLHDQLFPLWKALFGETNPIGIKAAMAIEGQLDEELRLPLLPMSPEARSKLQKAMESFGLLEGKPKRAENKGKIAIAGKRSKRA